MAKTVDVWKQMIPVTLQKDSGNDETTQFVCVNGRSYQVPIGKRVNVPLPVYEALREAQRAKAAAEAREKKMIEEEARAAQERMMLAAQ